MPTEAVLTECSYTVLATPVFILFVDDNNFVHNSVAILFRVLVIPVIMGSFIDYNFCLKFNCYARVYILKFCNLKIVSGAVDARKWSVKWRNWNISDIFFSCLGSSIPFFSLC